MTHYQVVVKGLPSPPPTPFGETMGPRGGSEGPRPNPAIVTSDRGPPRRRRFTTHTPCALERVPSSGTGEGCGGHPEEHSPSPQPDSEVRLGSSHVVDWGPSHERSRLDSNKPRSHTIRFFCTTSPMSIFKPLRPWHS